MLFCASSMSLVTRPESLQTWRPKERYQSYSWAKFQRTFRTRTRFGSMPSSPPRAASAASAASRWVVSTRNTTRPPSRILPAKPPGSSRAASAQRSSLVARDSGTGPPSESRWAAGSSTAGASAGQDRPSGAQRGPGEGWAHASPRRARATTLFLQDVAAQILVIHDLAEPLAHLVRVELDALLGQLREIEQHVLEQGRHDGVEPAGPDVLHALVRLGGNAGDLLDAVVRELERRALGRAQSGVLLGQGVLGL